MRAEILGPIVLLIFGGLTTAVSSKMPMGTLSAPGSGMFPVALGGLLMVMSAIAILRTLLGERRRREGAARLHITRSKVGLALLVMILVTAILNWAGYPLAAFLMVLGLVRILGEKGWVTSLVFSVMAAGGAHLVFVTWLKVPLPKGFLGL